VIVLDASAAVELLLNTATGKSIAARLRPETVTVHAPHLIDVEVTQVLRRYVLAQALSAERAVMALDCLRDLDLTRYAHEPFLPRMWELRANLTAYDAAYVSLAEALGAVLLTCDARLARAPGHVAQIEVASG
jgi:predicted nucleic acid-binding protein